MPSIAPTSAVSSDFPPPVMDGLNATAHDSGRGLEPATSGVTRRRPDCPLVRNAGRCPTGETDCKVLGKLFGALAPRPEALVLRLIATLAGHHRCGSVLRQP